jgi:hypothetical protein
VKEARLKKIYMLYDFKFIPFAEGRSIDNKKTSVARALGWNR